MSQLEPDDIESTDIDHTDPEVLERLYWDKEHDLEYISNLADVHSTTILHHMDKHNIDRRNRGCGNRKSHASFRTDTLGYEVAYSKYGDSQKRVKIHRLVAVAEHGFNAVVDKHVHHKNEIRWDNRPDNLSIMTPHSHHSHHSSGENSPVAKLNRSEVLQIDRLLKENIKHAEIAEAYDVAKRTISAISTGQNWSQVTGR
jgi:hypothetical protein